ncbi:MAG: hypothetical protein ACYDAG_13185, partial [Chloroflexota bacterium]
MRSPEPTTSVGFRRELPTGEGYPGCPFMEAQVLGTVWPPAGRFRDRQWEFPLASDDLSSVTSA